MAKSVFNSIPDNKILSQSNLKALADESNVTPAIKFVLGRIENIVGKGENVGYQHFSPSLAMFSKAIFPRVVKSWDCVVKR